MIRRRIIDEEKFFVEYSLANSSPCVDGPLKSKISGHTRTMPPLDDNEALEEREKIISIVIGLIFSAFSPESYTHNSFADKKDKLDTISCWFVIDYCQENTQTNALDKYFKKSL